jgi:heterodisulfide reductase subunit C
LQYEEGVELYKAPEEPTENKLKEEVEALCQAETAGCYQCGTCTAGCPFTEEMDIMPDEVIRYVVLGREEVLDSKTIWICSSCFTCAERCPRDIDITRVMDALRQIILRNNVDHVNISKLSKEELAEIPQVALVSCFRKNTA